jgi:hypothetical protein
MTDQNPYLAVLADLKAKRSELDTAIAAIERIMGVSSSAEQINAPIGSGVREGMFFGMSLTEAAKTYLSTVRKKQSAREIAEALERGGFHHTSKDFPNTVRAILARNAANEGEFLKLQSDWGLAQWFPGRRGSKGAKKDDSVANGAEAPSVVEEGGSVSADDEPSILDLEE